MKSITTYKQRVFGLDVVRAIAILLILCSHSTILLFPESSSTIVKTIQFFGTIGVDIFFVLSGFLIGTILIRHIQNQQTSLKQFISFWIRRWLRTLPNYYLVLIVNIGLLYIFNSEIPKQIYKFFFFLQNFSSQQPDFFTESWSLTIEEFAYIIGPVILLALGLFFKKLNKWSFLIMTCLVIVCITIHRFIFDVHLTKIPEHLSWSKILRKVVIYRIDSIYYGFLGAFFAFYFTKSWKQLKWLSFGFGVFLFVIIHLNIFSNQLNPDHFSTFFNIYYLPLVSISILLTFPVFSNWKKHVLLTPLITKISLWSYSIYLINYSIVLLTIRQFIDIDQVSLIAKFSILVLYWILTFAFSYLLFTFFEYPLIKFRNSINNKYLY